MSLLLNIIYYQDHKVAIGEILDELVEVVKAEPGDSPALTFSSLVDALGKDPHRAVTVCALAIMRLGDQNAGSAD